MTATFELTTDDLRPLILQYLSERLKGKVLEEAIEKIGVETDEDGDFLCLTVKVETAE